jgi:hypothetical protein
VSGFDNLFAMVSPPALPGSTAPTLFTQPQAAQQLTRYSAQQTTTCWPPLGRCNLDTVSYLLSHHPI